MVKPLRVLFLWNPAGALTPVADWLVGNGHSARIVMSREFDLYGNTSISPTAYMVGSGPAFYRAVVKQLLTYHPTHVHVNQGLPLLVLARLYCPRTPIVFQYHGIEVRYRSSAHPEVMLADRVLVSTPDLRRYGEWYDRPISGMFYYRGGRKKKTAIMFYVGFFMKDLRREAQKWCDNHGIKLTIITRGKDPGVPYQEMPEFLSHFEYFLDFKGYGDPDAVSRLAIEALACGCKVVSDTNPDKIIDRYDFPGPEKYFDLYASMKKPPISSRRLVMTLVGLAKWASGALTRNPERPVD